MTNLIKVLTKVGTILLAIGEILRQCNNLSESHNKMENNNYKKKKRRINRENK